MSKVSISSPVVRYYKGGEELAYYIISTCESTFNLWAAISDSIHKINIDNVGPIRTQVTDVVNMIDGETKLIVSSIYNGIDEFKDSKQVSSKKTRELLPLFQVAKFAYLIKDTKNDPIFNVCRVMELRECSEEIAIECIKVMAECGIHDTCSHYDLIKAIIEFASLIEIDLHDKLGYRSILDVDPNVYF